MSSHVLLLLSVNTHTLSSRSPIILTDNGSSRHNWDYMLSDVAQMRKCHLNLLSSLFFLLFTNAFDFVFKKKTPPLFPMVSLYHGSLVQRALFRPLQFVLLMRWLHSPWAQLHTHSCCWVWSEGHKERTLFECRYPLRKGLMKRKLLIRIFYWKSNWSGLKV